MDGLTCIGIHEHNPYSGDIWPTRWLPQWVEGEGPYQPPWSQAKNEVNVIVSLLQGKTIYESESNMVWDRKKKVSKSTE